MTGPGTCTGGVVVVVEFNVVVEDDGLVEDDVVAGRVGRGTGDGAAFDEPHAVISTTAPNVARERRARGVEWPQRHVRGPGSGLTAIRSAIRNGPSDLPAGAVGGSGR
ncbi:MAG: hypothetical protein ABJC79_08470, partial [Acidimicrobiia bacterium]